MEKISSKLTAMAILALMSHGACAAIVTAGGPWTGCTLTTGANQFAVYPTSTSTPSKNQLTPATIPNLGTAQIAALSPSVIRELSPQQIAAFTDQQIKQFNPAQSTACFSVMAGEMGQKFQCTTAVNAMKTMLNSREIQGLLTQVSSIKPQIDQLNTQINKVNCNNANANNLGNTNQQQTPALLKDGRHGPVAAS
ncbi:MAG: hypothetical protein V4490_01110 [Pseudomonadota bacterium]